MANVLDVACYILQKQGQITTWKLQKLCFYAQAWSLVWNNKPLFDSRIEAWANGPVIPDLYNRHRGAYCISEIDGNSSNLTKDQREIIDLTLGVYGDKEPTWLSELTHSEAPWLNARKRAGLGPGERGDSEITLDDMEEYYTGLILNIEKQ